MVQFKDLTIQQLKKIVRAYNLHTTIKGYSKMNKDELIRNLEKHIMLSYKRLIQPDVLSPDIDVSDIIDEPQRRKQEREQRAIKRAEQRARKRAEQRAPAQRAPAQPIAKRQAQPRAQQQAPVEKKETKETKSNIEKAIEQMETPIKEEKKAIERYKKKPKVNIEKYTIFDNKGDKNNDTVDLKFKVEGKEFEFNKVGIFNNPKDMDKHSGKGWRYTYGYSNRPDKVLNKQVKDGKINYPQDNFMMTDDELSRKHHIISSINDVPIHMAHIESGQSRGTRKLYISFVDVHPDFQGKGLAEKAFLLLWSYFHKYDLFKKNDINEIQLTYAASAPVVGTYIRMINAAGFHNPFTDELDFKNMTKEFKLFLHQNAYTIPFDFYIKDSRSYEVTKNDDDYEIITFKKLEKLNKLYNKVEKGGKIENVKEAFLLGYVLSALHAITVKQNDKQDIKKIIEKYEEIISSSQTKDITRDDYISPLELKIIQESIPILKAHREKLLNEQKQRRRTRRD